jgi:hypothetical protein
VGSILDLAYTKEFRSIIELNYPHLGALLESLGATDIHLPNFDLFPDDIFIYGPNGSSHTTKEVSEILIQTGRITGQNIFY